MKLIPLTQGQFAKVDDDDFIRFGGVKWYAWKNPHTVSFYATRSPYKGKRQYLHREIMGVTDPDVKVDHKNHDTLDNQRENLRPCTHSRNMQNRSGRNKNNTSGKRGVYLHTQAKRWVARIDINGKTKHLGIFADKEKAESAYDSANKKNYGEFGGVI